jgi:hypothetical protein
MLMERRPTSDRNPFRRLDLVRTHWLDGSLNSKCEANRLHGCSIAIALLETLLRVCVPGFLCLEGKRRFERSFTRGRGKCIRPWFSLGLEDRYSSLSINKSISSLLPLLMEKSKP